MQIKVDYVMSRWVKIMSKMKNILIIICSSRLHDLVTTVSSWGSQQACPGIQTCWDSQIVEHWEKNRILWVIFKSLWICHQCLNTLQLFRYILISLHTDGQILGHEAWFYGTDANFFKTLSKLAQLSIVVQLGTMKKTSCPGIDGSYEEENVRDQSLRRNVKCRNLKLNW